MRLQPGDEQPHEHRQDDHQPQPSRPPAITAPGAERVDHREDRAGSDLLLLHTAHLTADERDRDDHDCDLGMTAPPDQRDCHGERPAELLGRRR
jgi:hypothetical protein